MSRMLLSLLLLSTMALLVPQRVLADDGNGEEAGPAAGDWEFTLNGSGNSDKHIDSGGFGLGTSLGYFLTHNFEVVARHNMTFFDTDHSDSNFSATTRGALDFHIDFGRVQPFLGGNVGVRYGNGEIDTVGTAAPEWGIKLFPLDNTFILAMMEYQFFFNHVHEADDNFNNGQFVYTLGMGFNF